MTEQICDSTLYTKNPSIFHQFRFILKSENLQKIIRLVCGLHSIVCPKGEHREIVMGSVFSDLVPSGDDLNADGLTRVAAAAAMAFISTTVDDFIVIMYCMSRAEKSLAKNAARARHLGTDGTSRQYQTRVEAYCSIGAGVVLGFTVLVLFSLLGLLFSHSVDMGYVCLLGFIPIAIGIKQGLQYLRDFDEPLYLACCLRSCGGCLDSYEWMWTCGGRFTWLLTEETRGSSDEALDSASAMSGLENGSGAYSVVASGSDDAAEDEDEDNMHRTSGTGGTGGTGGAAVAVNPVLDADGSRGTGTLSPQEQQQDVQGRGNEQSEAHTGSSDEGRCDGDANGNETDIEVDLEAEMDAALAQTAASAEQSGGALKHWTGRSCSWCLQAQTLEVTLMMIGVGSDNVAIYMVIFAVDDVHEILLTILVFYLLLFVNLFLAAFLMHCRSVATCFQKYAEALVPLLLMVLGGLILQDSVLFGNAGIAVEKQRYRS